MEPPSVQNIGYYKVWDASNGQCVQTLEGHSYWVCINLQGELVGMLKAGDEAYGTGTMTLMVDIFDDIQNFRGATKVRIAPEPVP
ncbi:uncharacterized protein N7515_006692 [Penicillium bovifimosum]|uniref:Uncharacterized protein n=1 Tax=Penicillium bovifimosum TaxID=126998 RepID=A0A9W9KZZ4_9EURO|nr:uncharacterized protein N7515_006692 [Penicillium bovifimosum]KAJ5130653.1 hypothetical protein N7515_006692 [Penicillium bovifimosum]